MTGYRQMRTITGRKIFVQMTREEIRDRRLFRLEIVLTPLIMILVAAKCAGMI